MESFKIPTASAVTVSGAVASFKSEFALPLKSAKFNLVAQQSGSGTPSPTNPRAISGFSQISVSDNGDSHIVQLGDTYYGGEYDAVTGKFVATFGILDLGVLTWSLHSSIPNLFVSPISASLNINQPQPGRYANALCEKYKTGISPVSIISDPPDDKTIVIGRSGISYIYICDSSYTEASTFNNDINGVMLAYELATPIEIQLPPLLLSTIEGQNSFSCDTGDTEVQYIKVR